jgi:glycogen debranching enzyme
LLTRRYHGLLVAALDPPLGRTLLLTKVGETVAYGGRDDSLLSNRWSNGLVSPRGYVHVERFRLEGTTPVWDFACADALLEKRVWMEQGANTTYVRYDLQRATAPLTLAIKAIVNYRSYHSNTHAQDWQMRIDLVPEGLKVTPSADGVPFYLLCCRTVKGRKPERCPESLEGPVEAPSDGIEFEPQLTWMDTKAGEWVATPRIGKPVDINALWYNALCSMADSARRLGKSADNYWEMAEGARTGFARFWNDSLDFCFDVLDGPNGAELSLRPNQLLAVSMPHSPLDADQQRSVVDVSAQHLLTSHGLRSSSPADPAFVGHYGGNQRQRDGAYHQGTAWAWLIGPSVIAHLRVYGDPPFAPRGCIAQAWSVAQVLRAWEATEGQVSREYGECKLGAR